MKSIKRGSRLGNKSKGQSGQALQPKLMSYDEMIVAAPIEATESIPSFTQPSTNPTLVIKSDQEPRLSVRANRLALTEVQNLWGVCIESSSGHVLAGLPGESYKRISLKSLERAAAKQPEPEPYRPPWMRGEFFPRIAPRRLDGLAGIIARAVLPDNLGLHLFISEQLSRGWPWCTVGKVWFSRDGRNFNRDDASKGSGVLVGRNLMLTVSHAAPWGRGPGDWWMQFVPAYVSGDEPFGNSYVEAFHGVVNQDDVTGLDYVICKLYTPLGDRCGWMGSKWWSDEDPYHDGQWTSIGYPSSFMEGERPAVEFNIGVRDIDNDGDGLEVETLKFAEKGWSGGPLWGWIDGEPRVIGIESGYEKDVLDPTRTVFAGGEHMVNLVKFGIANWS